MDTWVWIVIAVAAVALVALGLWYVTRARQTTKLRETFGPEYDRTLSDAPSKREAEAELSERRERTEQFDVQPLSQTSRDRYLRAWEGTQARFVDDPPGAIDEADSLIQDVMRERGYPVEDFDQRAADLSVDHPDVVENYRAAHALAVRVDDGEVETEELRVAMVHYRSLFEDLLETREAAERTR
jgi:FtsZ-interacting cell division protein ZipA